jgi:hypothetical protein
VLLGEVLKVVGQCFNLLFDIIQPVESDLDVYLEEWVFMCEEGAVMDFDGSEWWKSG